MAEPATLIVTLTVEELREIVRGAVNEVTPPYYSQHTSPLGQRRHLELTRDGKLKGFRHGRLVLVRAEEVHAYIEAPPEPRPPRRAMPAPSADLPTLPKSTQALLGKVTSL